MLVPARLWPRLAPRCYTQHILCVRSARASLHTFILFAPTLLTREPLQRGIKGRTIWRCVTHRCGAVTARASRTSHSSGALKASAARTAPACRHRSRQHSRSAENEKPGLLPRMLAGAARTPTHPPERRPCYGLASFRPQGGLRGKLIGSLRSKMGNEVFCVGSFVFSSGFFLPCVSLHRPHCLAARPARPLVATF